MSFEDKVKKAAWESVKDVNSNDLADMARHYYERGARWAVTRTIKIIDEYAEDYFLKDDRYDKGARCALQEIRKILEEGE